MHQSLSSTSFLPSQHFIPSSLSQRTLHINNAKKQRSIENLGGSTLLGNSVSTDIPKGSYSSLSKADNYYTNNNTKVNYSLFASPRDETIKLNATNRTNMDGMVKSILAEIKTDSQLVPENADEINSLFEQGSVIVMAAEKNKVMLNDEIKALTRIEAQIDNEIRDEVKRSKALKAQLETVEGVRAKYIDDINKLESEIRSAKACISDKAVEQNKKESVLAKNIQKNERRGNVTKQNMAMREDEEKQEIEVLKERLVKYKMQEKKLQDELREAKQSLSFVKSQRANRRVNMAEKTQSFCGMLQYK